MKKRTKIRRRRSLALFLALTMTMSMALTAFAEEAPAPSDSAGKTADDNININIIDVPQDPPVFDLSQTERPGQTEGITVQPGAPENSAPGESDPGAKPAAPAGTDAPAEPTAPAETEPSAEPTASAGTEPSAEPTAPTGTEPSAEPTAPAKTEPSAEPTASAGTEPPAEPAAPAETETGSDPGTADGNITKPVDPDWDVFYDAARDTYKLTYKIPENAEGDQTIDLTYALELLGQYAHTAVAPQMPGVPEGIQDAFDKFAANAAADPAQSTVDKANEYLKAEGLDPEDPYIQEYARYMMDAADYKQVCSDWDSWVQNGDPYGYVASFGDLDTFLYYGCGFKNGEPKAPTPDINPDSEEYKQYEKALAEYQHRCEADKLQPGDVRKFEIYLSSGSRHTYIYKDGSFTLATPDWGTQSGGSDDVKGFDGQVLPGQYVDNTVYYVTVTAKPLQDLFKTIGMLDANHPLNSHGLSTL